MKRIKGYKLERLLRNELKNKSFRREYDSLAEEFQLAEEVIKLRIKKNMSQKELAGIVGTSQPAVAQ
ncbi:hypothetical protein NO2_1598 [Candidatus Termititenax persephonae]|uniref:HTH cro/C1-type domain-containing protein n=1 Tax=Candidatus Termititenax persephonae TaxID=2218525 RepID=A0A388TIR9_9BACT|nr:hypothetical protein NO2_1598 [Candidatus Termititenax persephonae]